MTFLWKCVCPWSWVTSPPLSFLSVLTCTICSVAVPGVFSNTKAWLMISDHFLSHTLASVSSLFFLPSNLHVRFCLELLCLSLGKRAPICDSPLSSICLYTPSPTHTYTHTTKHSLAHPRQSTVSLIIWKVSLFRRHGNSVSKNKDWVDLVLAPTTD